MTQNSSSSIRIYQSIDPSFILSVGDRVSHPDYAGIGLVDEILPQGVSVSWCEWEDSWHYMDQDFPLFTSGLQLVEKAETPILEVTA